MPKMETYEEPISLRLEAQETEAMENQYARIYEQEGIPLESLDGQVFYVPMAAKDISETLSHKVQDLIRFGGGNAPVHAHAPALEVVAQYIRHYLTDPQPEVPKQPPQDDLKNLVGEWYAEFFAKTDIHLLYDVITAASNLDLQPLIELGCLELAKRLKGKSPFEMRQILGMPLDLEDPTNPNNPLSAAEMAAVREQYKWVYE